jgi:hypothetical protein
VFREGDRWVRTFSEDELRGLLTDWEILDLVPTHYATSGPFDLAAGARNLPELLGWEDRCRAHPVTAPWNRAWTAAVRRPAG